MESEEHSARENIGCLTPSVLSSLMARCVVRRPQPAKIRKSAASCEHMIDHKVTTRNHTKIHVKKH